MPRAYRSDRRTEQARLTRQRVLAAATGLFERQGYAATTVRAVAAEAGVSTQTVEAQFGTKTLLLKTCIDVAIAGDDDSVPVLARDWTDVVRAADTPAAVLAEVVAVLGPAQERSAGLVLAVFEGAAVDPTLEKLAGELVQQRRDTAAWIVRQLRRTSPLRSSERDSVDTLWMLMDPAVHARLVHRLGWSRKRYERWFARSAEHLLVPDPPEARP